MSAQAIYDGIEASGIIAGMRGAFPPDVALSLAETMMDEDIHIFEFTMTSEQPLEAMQAVKKQYGDEAIAGMGTVLTVEDAKRVLDAGADFILSPVFQPEIVRYVMDAGVLVAPGIQTPTEAIAAWEMGVKLLKIFPIGALGLEYFKAIRGPLPHLKFTCNGAMDAENAHAFIQAGAVAVGMGGWLTGDGSWTDSKLRSRARILVNAVASAKEGQAPLREA